MSKSQEKKFETDTKMTFKFHKKTSYSNYRFIVQNKWTYQMLTTNRPLEIETKNWNKKKYKSYKDRKNVPTIQYKCISFICETNRNQAQYISVSVSKISNSFFADMNNKSTTSTFSFVFTWNKNQTNKKLAKTQNQTKKKEFIK